MYFLGSADKTPEDPWYAEGLRFSCERCGGCCTGGPGYVWVREEDRKRIADYLGISEEELIKKFCRRALGRYSLKEKENYDCIFLEPEGCRVYPVRPVQCTTFPFWERYLEDPTAWKGLGERCPGVGKGRLYSMEEIHHIMEGRDRT